MAGGDSEQAQAEVLQALRDFDKATGREIAGCTQLSVSSAGHSLLALYRRGYVGREPAPNGRAYAYWVKPSAPILQPPPKQRDRFRTQAAIFRIVADAKEGINSTDVAKIAKMTRGAAQKHLVALADMGAITRDRPSRKEGFLYRVVEGASVTNAPTTEELDAQWWAPIERAQELARASWKEGEGVAPTPAASLLEGFDKRREVWYNRGA